MNRARAVKLLKECLAEISHLKELHHDNQEYKLWIDKTLDIINEAIDEEAFDENDKKRFLRGQTLHLDWSWIDEASDKAEQNYYLTSLVTYETALKSIIQKYEMLEREMEVASIVKPGVSVAEELNRLFDGMQFHPRVIAASKSLFETGHYALAIFEAFKAVNNFVKQKTGLSLDGKDLMAKVFRKEEPIIKLNELKTRTEQDEQEGYKFLFMGAMVGIRNPKAHDNIVQTDPYRTLEYLGFASLLMKRIEEGRVAESHKTNVQTV